MRVLVVVHHRNAGPGVFADAATGHELVEWLPQASPPPRPDEFDAAIVLGAKAQVDEEDLYPWLHAEKELVGQLLSQGTPLLGVCFGSQLIAEAAGAVVRKAAAPELGWHSVELTAAGSGDPLLGFLPKRFESIQGHSYEWLLPQGAVMLARSARCLQAFRLDNRPVWGLQFHAEVTEADYNSWLDSWDAETALASGLDRDAVRAETAAKIGTWNAIGRGIAERFLASQRAHGAAAPATLVSALASASASTRTIGRSSADW